MKSSQSLSPRKILCVDCDGTLVATDLLHESLIRFLLRRPWMVFHLFFWFLAGRSVLKEKLSPLVEIDVSRLPYRKEVIDLIESQKCAGSKVFLVTAANRHFAMRIADHLGCFDGVFASDESLNLKGANKERFLVDRFGRGEFVYVGDSHADLTVWASASVAVVAGRDASFLEKVKKVNPTAELLEGEAGRQPTVKALFKLLRIHQWAKNLILFVPIITSHQLLNPAVCFASLAAFFALSFVASATYIVNDLFDLDHDRAHPRKRRRPLASGVVSIPLGCAIAGVLFFSGVLIAFGLPKVFMALLALYVLLTLSYSISLKRVVLADAILLAGLYTLRLLIGHAATGIPLSVWLLAFAIFIFFSLALAKRFVEINDLQKNADYFQQIKGRGYLASDLGLVGMLGTSSGVVAILVLILYVNSPEVRDLYASPILLLLLAPLFLYWVSRIWLLASRGGLHDDPVLFAVKDRVSYAIGLGTIAVIALASLYK
jgi:4-hydroxybenzoate polyprenyltransferase/phosphoserine phosphatase